MIHIKHLSSQPMMSLQNTEMGHRRLESRIEA
jgi:hypothetical protein